MNVFVQNEKFSAESAHSEGFYIQFAFFGLFFLCLCPRHEMPFFGARWSDIGAGGGDTVLSAFFCLCRDVPKLKKERVKHMPLDTFSPTFLESTMLLFFFVHQHLRRWGHGCRQLPSTANLSPQCGPIPTSRRQPCWAVTLTRQTLRGDTPHGLAGPALPGGPIQPAALIPSHRPPPTNE